MNSIKKFFKIEEAGSNIRTEILAGLTTFFTMAYIMFVNPNILGATGIPWGAVFLATIFASVAGTLVMGLFANVPYAQAPGMGLNAFFANTIVGVGAIGFGFSWQAALAIVFLCGVINVIITVTKVRKLLIKAIPDVLKNAIAGGIGLFIAYVGLLNSGLITLSPVPALGSFDNIGNILTMAGIVLTVVLLLLKVKGAIIIGIIVTTLLTLVTGVQSLDGFAFNFGQIGDNFSELGTTFGAAFTVGFSDLFKDASMLPMALLAIFSLSLADTFDTIGTFIGTGRRSGIFSKEDELALETSTGFKSKMDKALFADSIATSVGAVLGTSNTTTYVESAAGIGAGGRTGLTSVVVAACFLLSILLSPVAGLVNSVATAPALIIVGIMMVSSFKDIDWSNFEDAVPAFFTAVIMVLSYNISTGIAFGFIFYSLVKLAVGKIKEVHPIVWGTAIVFIIYYAFMALSTAGII